MQEKIGNFFKIFFNIPVFDGKTHKKGQKKSQQPGAGCSPLMGLLHLGLGVGYFPGEARDRYTIACQ